MGILNRIIGVLGLQRRVEPAVKRAAPQQPVVKVYGTHGRLEIPSLFISVPLYDSRGADNQRVVDNPNSAAYMHWQKQDAIADHASQASFSNLNMVKPGKTVATIDLRNRQEKYLCVNSQIGHIRLSPNGNRIFDANWNSANFQNEGGLCIYTCIQRSSEDVMDVRLTYWQQIQE